MQLPVVWFRCIFENIWDMYFIVFYIFALYLGLMAWNPIVPEVLGARGLMGVDLSFGGRTSDPPLGRRFITFRHISQDSFVTFGCCSNVVSENSPILHEQVHACRS